MHYRAVLEIGGTSLRDLELLRRERKRVDYEFPDVRWPSVPSRPPGLHADAGA
jgi:hypothetical protein